MVALPQPLRGPHPLAAHLAASWSAALAMPDPQASLLRFHAGLAAYQRHPWHRDLPQMPLLARNGAISLRDYGPAQGAPLLVIPSLINSADVLDLTAETSLLRWLSRQGLRPLLVDWGTPGPEEAGYDLDAYVTRGLLPLLHALDGPVSVLGYCLGGTLAVALSALAPTRIRALVTLAAPWDMLGYSPDQRARVSALWSDWEAQSLPLGALPMELLQMLFLGLDPTLTLSKFSRFAGLDADGKDACTFVALEDWTNSGPPLALPAGAQLFRSWYESGGPAHGWNIAGRPVVCGAQPALVVLAANDRIVPDAAARPLATHWPGAQLLQLTAGHVGMVVGRRRQAMLWEPVRDFLHRH